MNSERDRENPEEPTAGTPSAETGQEAEQAVEGDIRRLSEELEKVTLERDQLQQQVLRTMADFQNMRRRNQKEMAEFRQYATENLVRDLLPVLDNFERTIRHLEAGASVESVMDGIRAVERQLRRALETQNVRRIDAVGTPFDPERHEAIGHDAPDGHAENTVTAEVEPGYTMGDRVVRHARVRVARGG